MVVKKLFHKFEPQDMVSLINMNQLKQCIGLQTQESNPQSSFEQMAALENQFKKTMGDSEKIAIAIEKLLVKYQPVLTAERRKEASLYIENAAFQHWWSVHGLYANNTVVIVPARKKKIKEKNWLLQHSVE